MAAAAIDADDEQAGINVAYDDPHRLARLHLRLAHHHEHRPTLVCQGDELLAWNGRSWQEVTTEMDAALFRTARAEFERQNKLSLAAYDAMPSEQKKGKQPPTVHQINNQTIANIKLALGALVAVPAKQQRPSWLGGTQPFPAREILAFPNDLVHLPTFVAMTGTDSLKPTPRFFSTRCLPFEFDALAEDPQQWLKFLGQILGDDVQSRDLLQEWFGYCLTADTSQQKILMLVGPTRSGKGTVGRILNRLLGPECAVGLSFASLATNFGLQPLVDKTLAVVGDARLSSRSDQVVIVERILNISGEDSITVDRKHRSPWEGTLPTRIMLLSNELPELRDASMALANRLLIIHLKNSFLGKEDTKLIDKLSPELPGILLWAFEGWERLHGHGRFVAPASSEDVMESMKNLSSPVAAFIADCCVRAPNHHITTDRLFTAYKCWCQKKGKKPVDSIRFGQQLRAAASGVENRRLKLSPSDTKKTAVYDGISLQQGVLPDEGSLAS
jgi:putative DNA primase/helicase